MIKINRVTNGPAIASRAKNNERQDTSVRERLEASETKRVSLRLRDLSDLMRKIYIYTRAEIRKPRLNLHRFDGFFFWVKLLSETTMFCYK